MNNGVLSSSVRRLFISLY